MQVQNGGCNSLQGNFLLRNRRKTFFVSLLTLFQIHAEVDDVLLVPRERG